MIRIVVERDNGWLIIRDSKGNSWKYLYYTRRERLKKFKEQFGHTYKRVKIYDYTK